MNNNNNFIYNLFNINITVSIFFSKEATRKDNQTIFPPKKQNYDSLALSLNLMEPRLLETFFHDEPVAVWCLDGRRVGVKCVDVGFCVVVSAINACGVTAFDMMLLDCNCISKLD